MAWQLGIRRIELPGRQRIAIRPDGIWLDRHTREVIGTSKRPYVLVYWDAGLRKLSLRFFSDPAESEAPEHIYKVTAKPCSSAAKIPCPQLIHQWDLCNLAKREAETASFTIVPEEERGEDFWVAAIQPKRKRETVQ